jgi:hypothetical protein
MAQTSSKESKLSVSHTDDEFWGPIYGPGGPRIRAAIQVSEIVKQIEIVDSAVAGFGAGAIARFIDDCGTPVPGHRPVGWHGPWPPKSDGFDGSDLVTLGSAFVEVSRELASPELAKAARAGGEQLIKAGLQRL